MSIRNKLILLMLALLTAISAVLALLFLHSELASISSNSRKKNIQVLLAMAEVCKESRGANGKSYAYKYFKTFLKTPDIALVSCSDGRGRIFMEDRYDTPQQHALPRLFIPFSPPQTGVWETRYVNGAEILSASMDTWNSGKKITAHVDFSTQILYEEMNSSLRKSAADFSIILSIAFALGCAGTLIITRVVVAPIQTMAEAARIIGSGRLNHRIPVNSRDEMGMLASEFNEMADRLKEFDEMKRDFVSSITHDLRSPVTGIELCSDIIKTFVEKREYGKIPEQLFSVTEHLQRLNNFIDSLLEVSRIESGKMTLDIRTVNLEDLADRAVRSFKTYASTKGINLEFIVGQDIPDTRGDPDRLYQVLANVIGNAVKFTNSGSIRVFTQTEPGWQKIRVCDTGIGIPEHEIKNIFSKFYRIRPAGREYPSARQGMGLGLFIAKSIAEQHGGRIEVESSVGRGSAFTISLPA